MKTLDRYVIRNFLLSALLWFLVLMAIRIVADLFVNLDEFAEGDPGWRAVAHAIVSYYGYQSLVYFSELGGVIIVAAATFSLAMMNHTNELTAMMASGVSLYRVVWPVVVCAMLLGGAVIADQELLIPRVAHQLIRSQDEALGQGPFALRLMMDGQNTVWYSPQFDPATGCMAAPQLILRDSDYRQVAGISGQMAAPAELEGQKGWRIHSGSLVRMSVPGRFWMHRPTCRRIYTSAGPDTLARGGKASSRLRIRGEDAYYGLTIRAQELAREEGVPVLRQVRFAFAAGERVLCTFIAPAAQWQQDENGQWCWNLQDASLFCASDLTGADLVLRQSGEWMHYMSSRQLGRLLRMERAPDPQQVRLIRHTRLTDPLSNLVMLLLALPFILSRERNIKSSASMCVGMVGAYYACVYLCRYVVPLAALASWLPILAFAPVAALMLDSVKT
jgi:hypothetical protein